MVRYFKGRGLDPKIPETKKCCRKLFYILAMNDENVENLLRVGSAGDRVPSASGSRGGSANGQRFSAPQNSARDPDPSIIIPNSGTNKIYQVTKPASNVFIDTGTDISLFQVGKLGCVVRMVVDSILPHAEFGPNDHQKDALF